MKAVAEEFGGQNLMSPEERLMNMTTAVRRLERLGRTLPLLDGNIDLFFKVVGVTISQLRYLEYARGLRVPELDPADQGPLSEALKHASPDSPTSRTPLVLDFGMSRGADAEYYLLSGARVVAVEANPSFVEGASRRLSAFVDSGRLSIVHAAVGGDVAGAGGEEAVDFYVDHHHAERSGLLEEGGPAPEGDVTRTVVPRRSCGAIYAAAVANGPPSIYSRAQYAKIDIEGEDVACLRSIVDLGSGCSSGRCKNELGDSGVPPPLPPVYISLELGRINEFWKKKRLDMAVVNQLEAELRELLRGRYCAAKFCRQALYNSRFVRGHNNLVMPMSRAGLGSSGPFGDAAADWRSGGAWRPLEEVLSELPIVAHLTNRAPGEWFDLHLRHCPL